MLKLNASYSKKIPAEGEYSSQSYHAAVEVELSDGLSPDQLQARIHETFELVRASVEAELHAAPVAARSQAPNQAPAPRQFQQRELPPASGKQLGFLRDMALKRGYTPRQLDEEVHRRYGVPDLAGLDRRQASEMLDEFGGGRASQRRAA